ncbi:MAG TPA: prepilin-type N-terminal cleavage/methylation domain-containing protein [Aliidongia sp.]|nr:prepilin-type N-terminal cleavage/methylation domain-containing protein [Aliidongia sp.]
MSARRPEREAGFTLIEILIGLVVLGLLMAGLSQGVRYGLKARDAQSRLVGQRDGLDALDRALRQLIGQMPIGKTPSEAHFHGSDDHLDFVTVLPEAAALDTRRADAALLVDNHRLVLRWSPHRHEQSFADLPAETETELLSGLDHVEFSYAYAIGTNGQTDGWRREWPGPMPPDLVKIHFVFTQKDRLQWPDMIVARALDPG